MTTGRRPGPPTGHYRPPVEGARRTVGMLWGDFAWEERGRKVGKLLSMWEVGRTTTQALRASCDVLPYRPPADPTEGGRRAALESFLRRIDVLWADVYAGSGPALQLRHDLGLTCPAVLYAGGAVPKGVDAMLFPWQHLLRPGDGIWFTCRADQTIWRRLVRRSALREWVIPHGVDDALFRPRPAEERTAARAQHGLPVEAPLLLYVGRLNIQKNLHSLLRLFAIVRRCVPDAHLCFVGEEDDIKLGEFGVSNSGYVARLHALAAELGVAGAAHFTGPLFGEDLARIYAAVDVVVSASFYHRENFGMSQAEAQACGVPVVCSAWGGFKDVVRHGETGYLMEAVLTRHGVRVDWGTGAQYVVRLLQDAGLCTRMGARAAAWARARFGMAAYGEALGRVVGEVVVEAGHAPARDTQRATTAAAPAYEPSAFARRYEAHKRACGWYANADSPGPFPRMFQGRDYALYERLMHPYATRLARELAPHAITPDWVPYLAAAATLDPGRRVAEDHDPVWPHRRRCSPAEWAVLRRVDGAATVDDVTAAAAVDCTSAGEAALVGALWRLHVDGFVLFRRGENGDAVPALRKGAAGGGGGTSSPPRGRPRVPAPATGPRGRDQPSGHSPASPTGEGGRWPEVFYEAVRGER